MDKPLETLQNRINAIRNSAASPSLLTNLNVLLSDCTAKLNGLATVSKVTATILKVTPYNKMYTKPIEKAIASANLGVNPCSNGMDITVEFPMLTSDRREELCKLVRKYGEEAKIAVRQERQKLNDDVKRSDMADGEKRLERVSIQQRTDYFIAQIDDIVANKCKSIMEI